MKKITKIIPPRIFNKKIEASLVELDKKLAEIKEQIQLMPKTSIENKSFTKISKDQKNQTR